MKPSGEPENTPHAAQWRRSLANHAQASVEGPLADLVFRALSLVNVFPFVPSDVSLGGLFVHREQQLYVFHLPKRNLLVFVALTSPYSDSIAVLLRSFAELIQSGDFR